MVKRLLSMLGCFVALTLLFCGCATTKVSVKPGFSDITKKSIVSRPVELPGDYDVDDMRRLVMGINGGQIITNNGAFISEKNIEYMNTRFQSEMDKRKRFKFIALWGGSTGNIDALKDSGEIESDDAEESQGMRNPELVLNWIVKIDQQKVSKGSRAQELQFLCTVNATVKYNRNVRVKGSNKVKHPKGELAFTDDFDLPVITKQQRFNSMGGLQAGSFDARSDASVQALLQEIIIATTKRISENLGRRFPVGGDIIAALGNDLMTMNKGTEQGVEPDMEMVVIARYNKVDVPLANATAKPQKENTTLHVWRLSNVKYARQILAEINNKPEDWMKNTGNRLFAVRMVPKQNENEGTRFE